MYDDVADSLRIVSNHIENISNKDFFSRRGYGDSVEKWAFIAIILPPEIEGYTEYRRYHKARKVIEFRLRIDYFEFRDGDESTQMKLICEGLVRSLEGLDKNPVSNFDHMRLKEDFVEFCKKQKWL